MYGNWSAESGEAGLRRLLEQRPDLDALFVGNDQMAIGALQAAHRLGRSIPQSLALVGFDNIPESRYFWPPLTTVHQGLFEIGRLALQAVHEAIESPTAEGERHLSVQPDLIVRESSRVPEHNY